MLLYDAIREFSLLPIPAFVGTGDMLGSRGKEKKKEKSGRTVAREAAGCPPVRLQFGELPMV